MRRLGVLWLVMVAFAACSSGDNNTHSATNVATLRPTSTDVTQPIEQMQMKASQATDMLIAHKWDQVVADFDATMKAGLTAEGLKTAWAQVEAQFGPYQSRGTTTRVRPQAAELVFDTPLMFSKQAGKSRISYDRDGKIAGLYILRADVP